MLQWRQMEIFIAAVEEGSFTAAAELLDISPTAVGKQIRNLEDLAQEPLFNRTTRKIVLTRFGEEYYKTCKKAALEMEKAQLLIESRHKELNGVLHLHAPPFIAGFSVLPILKQFMERHPNLKVELSISDGLPNLLDTDIDILVGYDLDFVSSQQHLRACHLLEVEDVLVASPDYLSRFGTPASLQDLYKHRFIHHSLAPQPLELSFLGGEVVSNLNTVLALGDRRVMCIAAVHGIGIAFTGIRSVLPELKGKQLVRVLPEHSLGKRTLAAFYKYTATEQPKVQEFLSALKVFFTNFTSNPYFGDYIIRSKAQSPLDGFGELK